MTHTVLVYGTLRPFKNDNIVLVPGVLYDISWFPGIVLGNHSSDSGGESFVTCERIEVSDERLVELDRYEGYYEDAPEASLYLRKKIGNDWIYVFNESVEGKTIIASGDWQRYKSPAEEEEVFV